MKTFIEKNCTLTHEGRTYEAGGAVVTPDLIVAYLGDGGALTDWHGNQIGTYKITATWGTSRSWVSPTMSQVYANVDGVQYTGRSGGRGMIYKGKRVKNQ